MSCGGCSSVKDNKVHYLGCCDFCKNNCAVQDTPCFKRAMETGATIVLPCSGYCGECSHKTYCSEFKELS